jgi:hypothetical protein
VAHHGVHALRQRRNVLGQIGGRQAFVHALFVHGLPSATLAAMVSLNITTSWLTMANWLRREARFQVLSSCPSSVIWPWLLLTKRGSRLTSVVLPAPEGPPAPRSRPVPHAG